MAAEIVDVIGESALRWRNEHDEIVLEETAGRVRGGLEASFPTVLL